MEELQALPIPTNCNIWSDEISMEDFSYWFAELERLSTLQRGSSDLVIEQISCLVWGTGLTSRNWDVGVRFGQNRPLNFTTDLCQLFSEAQAVHARINYYAQLRDSIQTLSLYRETRYRQTIQARMAFEHEEKDRFYCFSSSNVLDQLEIQGIMQLIHAFGVRKFDRSKIETRFLESVRWIGASLEAYQLNYQND